MTKDFSHSAWKLFAQTHIRILLADLRARYRMEQPDATSEGIDWRVLSETRSLLESPKLIWIHDEAAKVLDADLKAGIETPALAKHFASDLREILDLERHSFNPTVFSQLVAKLDS